MQMSYSKFTNLMWGWIVNMVKKLGGRAVSYEQRAMSFLYF